MILKFESGPGAAWRHNSCTEQQEVLWQEDILSLNLLCFQGQVYQASVEGWSLEHLQRSAAYAEAISQHFCKLRVTALVES